MDSNEAIRRLEQHRNQLIEQVEQLGAMISNLQADGLTMARLPTGPDTDPIVPEPLTGEPIRESILERAGSPHATAGATPDYPSDAEKESMIRETLGLSPSDQPATPTFRVGVECGCVGHHWIENPPGTWELRCRHDALWAYVEIAAPDVAPGT